MDVRSQISSLAVGDLLERLAARRPTPGGGTAAALAGALGAALVEMVAAFSSTPDDGAGKGELGEIAAAATHLRQELLALADADADAYDAVLAARRLPRGTPEERSERSLRVADALGHAIAVPLRTAEAGAQLLELAARIESIGNPNLVSDAGVAAALAAAAVRGAVLNVRVNLPGLPADDPSRRAAEERCSELAALATKHADRVAAAVDARLTTR